MSCSSENVLHIFIDYNNLQSFKSLEPNVVIKSMYSMHVVKVYVFYTESVSDELAAKLSFWPLALILSTIKSLSMFRNSETK